MSVPEIVHITYIADGDLGIYQTLAVMRRLARKASTSLPVKRLATEWTLGARTPLEAAQQLRARLYDAYRFVADPVAETIYAPELLVRLLESDGSIEGDCDDVATLAAALGLAAGLPASFVVVAEDTGERVPPFSHVFAVLHPKAGIDGGAVEVDVDLSRPATTVPVARAVAVWV